MCWYRLGMGPRWMRFVILNDCPFNRFSSQKTQSCVSIQMCTCLRTWDTQNMQMTATIQVLRWRTAITTPGLRCWRRSQCQAPAQRLQGWEVYRVAVSYPIAVDIFSICLVLGMVSRGATAETPKPCSASLHLHLSMYGEAGERLRCAQHHCEYSWQCHKDYGGFVNVVTGPEWVQIYPGREDSLLELCVCVERIAKVLTVVGIVPLDLS